MELGLLLEKEKEKMTESDIIFAIGATIFLGIAFGFTYLVYKDSRSR